MSPATTRELTYVKFIILCRNLFGTLLSLQPQIPSAGHGESREEKVSKVRTTVFLNNATN